VGALLGIDWTSAKDLVLGYEQYIEERVPLAQNALAGTLLLKSSEILSLITPEELTSASVKDKALVFGILYDKYRLQSGQATGRVEHQHSIAGLLKERRMTHAEDSPPIVDAEVVKCEESEHSPVETPFDMPAGAETT